MICRSDYRLPLVLHYFSGMSLETIAAELKSNPPHGRRHGCIVGESCCRTSSRKRACTLSQGCCQRFSPSRSRRRSPTHRAACFRDLHGAGGIGSVDRPHNPAVVRRGDAAKAGGGDCAHGECGIGAGAYRRRFQSLSFPRINLGGITRWIHRLFEARPVRLSENHAPSSAPAQSVATADHGSSQDAAANPSPGQRRPLPMQPSKAVAAANKPPPADARTLNISEPDPLILAQKHAAIQNGT